MDSHVKQEKEEVERTLEHMLATPCQDERERAGALSKRLLAECKQVHPHILFEPCPFLLLLS
jgi:hypothetical protein